MDNQEKNINDQVNGEENNTEKSSAVEQKTEPTAKPKKKSSGNGPVRIIVLVLCLAVFAFSGYKIVSEIIDGSDTEHMSDDIWNTVRGDDDDSGSDPDTDVNVPPAPIDPNVSGSGTGTSSGKTDNTESSGGTDNTDNTENNTDQTTTPSTDTNSGSENDVYNDRTYEEELADQENTKEEEDTQYYISRPSSDKEKSESGVVIRPEDIDISTIPYLKVSNLKSLLKTNEDTVGWIYVPGSKSEAKGTPIDTAIVQTTDNEYYLTHTFDKKENINGWVYADYRCNLDSITSNYNTVIYGHARSYKMFGGLKDLDEAVEWYSNGNNHFIKINTFNDETVWQIFSWYETDVYYDYIKTDFMDSNDFIRFAYEVQSKNQIEGAFETFEFDENDRILTLSTCKGFDRAVRVAVHAKLVKRNPIGD